MWHISMWLVLQVLSNSRIPAEAIGNLLLNGCYSPYQNLPTQYQIEVSSHFEHLILWVCELEMTQAICVASWKLMLS